MFRAVKLDICSWACPSSLSIALLSTSSAFLKESCKILIVGGGSGGITMAARILKLGEKSVTIVEPSEVHYYQPYFTLVGGQKKKFERSYRSTNSLIPKGAKWIKDSVESFEPSKNIVRTLNNGEIEYEFLVVALGMKLSFERIKGLPPALESKGVCSNYSPETVRKTAKALDDFVEGNAIFTQPVNPIKCGGAPQKIMYLAEEYFTKTGKRSKANIIFNSANSSFFTAPLYSVALEKVAKGKGMTINLLHNLVEVKPDKREAVFDKLDNKGNVLGKEVFQYEMLHVTPPMNAPPVLCGSPLADTSGYLDVHQNTLQSKKFENVFGIGDCTNLPTSKTAAAVASQCGVLSQNIQLAMKGKPLKQEYHGYTSCPLTTGYNKGVLAEFNYKLLPEETLPLDQSKERYISYLLKKEMMPFLYWNLMLKGYWSGPKFLRKLFHLYLV